MKNKKLFFFLSAALATLIDSSVCLEYSETHYMSDGYGNIKYGYTLQTGDSKVQFQQEPSKLLLPARTLIYRPVFGFGGFRSMQYGPPLLRIMQPRSIILVPSATVTDLSSKRVTRAKPTDARKPKSAKIVQIDKSHVPRYPIRHKLDQRTLYSHGHLYSDDPLAGYYIG